MSLAARPSAIGPADTNLQVNVVFLCVIEAVKNRGQNTSINCDNDRRLALLTRPLWVP